ncbi:hypothetical protein BJ875DRAFT_442163 [Amylocarpus encephaloides]|uniref:Uncharacterized protein n=1 Tax=Amylocarpus encephaloides TaxID=45428 RepID=A0A9P8C5Z1_9HELO|nr:hypothetical protein BJ875DRAFT_442163 [Amylocarpus encephaloides]
MQRLGIFMWHSPDAQTGQGIGAVIMAVNHQELRGREVEPQTEALGRDMVYFSRLSEALLRHTADETWQTVLGQVAEGVTEQTYVFTSRTRGNKTFRILMLEQRAYYIGS